MAISAVKKFTDPPFWLSILPVAALLTAIISAICIYGASVVQDFSYIILGGASLLCLALAHIFTSRKRTLVPGLRKSARQILPAIPILLLIGTLSSTWTLSGVVPLMIKHGISLLNPSTFLFVTCLTCAAVSVMTGSSWTTIATIGVAFMGIGTVMGYSPGWIAGAIISGAYFGDKVSPLSDTTVLASSSCGVPLLTHIRFLMLTSLPAIIISLIVFLLVGVVSTPESNVSAHAITEGLEHTFNLSPLLLAIPAVTLVLIALRVNTYITLAVGSLAGLAGIFLAQPQILAALGHGNFMGSLQILLTSTSISTGSDLLDPLIATGGMRGMLPTVYLVVSAMIFGGVMIGSGMLGTITHSITQRLRRSHSLIGATVGSGLFLNSCTGDQYLSIIIGSNIYRNTYRRLGFKPQVLSRTIEDSVSVTSVLIPWNSCGITQSTVLGVATLVYLPFCLFNILSPLLTIALGCTGWKLRRPEVAVSSRNN